MRSSAGLIYSLLVMSHPASGHGSRIAAAFARSALARGHRIHRVFFLDHGAAVGAAGAVFPQDEENPLDLWVELAAGHSLELVVCVSSALRRGILDWREAERHERGAATIHRAFTIAGLGQLVDAWTSSERLVTFGG